MVTPITKSLTRMILAPVLVLAMFLVVALVSVSTLLSLNEDALYSRETENKLHELQGTFVDMETGLRGYIASRNEAFLNLYWEGKEKLLSLLLALHGRAAGGTNREIDAL